MQKVIAGIIKHCIAIVISFMLHYLVILISSAATMQIEISIDSVKMQLHHDVSAFQKEKHINEVKLDGGFVIINYLACS